MVQKKLSLQDPKVFQKLNMDLDDLPLKDLLTLVQENPGLLRRPIMIDEKRDSKLVLMKMKSVVSLPRDVRQLELRQSTIDGRLIKIE